MKSVRAERLEKLVDEAAGRLRRTAEQNKKLRETCLRLETRNAELELDVRRLGALPARQARLRARLERLLSRLDKAAEAL